MHGIDPRRIGLSRSANAGAVDTLLKGIIEYNIDNEIESDLEEEISDAITEWELFYENME